MVRYLVVEWSLSGIHIKPRSQIQLTRTTGDNSKAQDIDWIGFEVHKDCLQSKTLKWYILAFEGPKSKLNQVNSM